MTSDGSSIYWVEFNAHTIRQGVMTTASVTTLVGTPPACTATCAGATAPAGGYAEGTGAAAMLSNPFSMVFRYPSSSLFFYDEGTSSYVVFNRMLG